MEMLMKELPPYQSYLIKEVCFLFRNLGATDNNVANIMVSYFIHHYF